jgi:luciferase family oxidoreductase group 1
MRALRRDATSADGFPQDVLELQGYLQGRSHIPGVEAVPGAGTNVPLYILGSSDYGAQLAARLGLPYGFASHFAPAELHPAVARYRAEFRPSEQLAEPYVIVGANVVAADDTADAQEQFATVRRRFVRSMIGRRAGAPDYADEQIDAFLTSPNGRPIADMLRYTAVGTVAEVGSYLEQFAASVRADEVIVAHHGVDVAARLRSVELTAEAAGLATPV